MTRPPVLLAASTALAALALAGCGGSGSVSSSSGTVGGGATVSATAPSSPDVSASASSLASGASSAANQLQAAKDCLQKANLPTPTSTDATGLLQELPKLAADPKVKQALQQCGINIPGVS
jgi:hypothetical protein